MITLDVSNDRCEWVSNKAEYLPSEVNCKKYGMGEYCNIAKQEEDDSYFCH